MHRVRRAVRRHDPTAPRLAGLHIAYRDLEDQKRETRTVQTLSGLSAPTPADLTARFPGLAGNLIDDGGSLHKFVNVYRDDDDIRYLAGLDTEVTDGNVISILPAVAGG